MNAAIDPRPLLASCYRAVHGAEVCQLRGVKVWVPAASRLQKLDPPAEGSRTSLGPEPQAPARGHLVLLLLVASSASGRVFGSVLFSLFCLEQHRIWYLRSDSSEDSWRPASPFAPELKSIRV